MGRLNYTNRKIEGLKLGQVVNKDLVKRIPPHTGSKAAFRDPAVELDVSGKALKDEGFFEVASALVESLCYDGFQGRCVRLEELCMKENQLTAASLQALAPIIRLACNDLRDLDLSGNAITISTEDEVALWEEFLTSFEQCCTLRRIDLSGNALGPRAFEVLVRVYAKEGPIDLILPPDLEQKQDEIQSLSTDKMRKMSIIPNPEEYGIDGNNNPTPQKSKSSRQDSKSHEKASTTVAQAGPLPIYATTRGLRSVPYLVLYNTAMTETCALHLSYVLASHHTPGHVLTRVPAARAGPPAQQLLAYDDDSQCRGIIYRPNSQLSNAGLKVLELSEIMRNGRSDTSEEAGPGPSQKPFDSKNPTRRTSGAGTKPTLVAGDRRRRSTLQTGTLDQGGEGGELDRARSRIQGNTLQEAGPQSNELWWATLKMLSLGREIQPQTKNGPRLPLAPKAKAPIIKTLTIPRMSKPKMLKPFTPLTIERDPNRPISPWNMNFPKKMDTIPPTPNVIPPTPITPKNVPESWDTVAEKKTSRKFDKAYRTKLPGGFSEDAWWRILGHVAGADGILSADQQRSVLRYAMDRKTLSKEREALGLTLAAQIWRVLEGTGCLAYRMDI